MSWQAVFAANAVIAGAYGTISFLVTRGLLRSRQFGPRNWLGTATAAIFFTCAAGHAVHAEHLLIDTPTRAVVDWHLAIADGITGIVAVGYLSLRQAFGQLLHQPSMFEDVVRRAGEEELRVAEERMRLSFDSAPFGMALVSLDGRFLRVNPALCRITGRSAQDLTRLTFQEITHPDDLEADEALVTRLIAGEIPDYRLRKRYVKPDGRHVTIDLSVSLVRDAEGDPKHLVGQMEDITREVAAEEARARAEAKLSAVLASSPNGTCVVDLDGSAGGRIVRVNPALKRIIGSGALDRPLAEAVHPDDHEALATMLASIRPSDDAPVQIEMRLLGQDAPVWVLVGAAELGAEAGPRRAVLQVVDITERKRFEHRLRDLADHDTLTGLHNRRRFGEELDGALARARRYGEKGAVLLLDLDGFKDVNDSLGHSAGDELIVRCATVLGGRLRDSDVLARLGGDEFAVILPHTDEIAAREVAEKLLAAIRRDVVLIEGGHHARVTASVGIAVFDGETEASREDVVAQADIAMYDAKDAGRNAVRSFRGQDRREQLAERVEWVARLRGGLENDRFRLVAQPIVGIAEQDLARYELLLRYVADDGELVPPGRFLDLAERLDLIRDIDLWVLGQACALLTSEHACGRDVAFSVNVSARTLGDPRLVATIEELVAAGGFPPERLILEVTETAAIANIGRAQELIGALHRVGCSLALDDFGAGFASFYYLKHLRFDYVKIDGEFIRGLPRDGTDRLVVSAVVSIARGLGAKTVAEFVGDDATVSILDALGVDYGQGYHLGRPAPLDEILSPDPTAS